MIHHHHPRSIRGSRVRISSHRTAREVQAVFAFFSDTGSLRELAATAANEANAPLFPTADDICRSIIAERGGVSPNKRETWAYSVVASLPVNIQTSPETAKTFATFAAEWMKKHCRGNMLFAAIHADPEHLVVTAIMSTFDPTTRRPFFGHWAKRDKMTELQATFYDEVALPFDHCGRTANRHISKPDEASLSDLGHGDANHVTNQGDIGLRKHFRS